MESVEAGLLAREVLWGVAVWRLGAAAVILFLGFLSRRVITSAFSGVLHRRARQTRLDWDDDAVELLPAPLALVVQIVLWYVAALLLDLPREPLDVFAFVRAGLIAALAVALTWVAFRLFDVVSLSLARVAEQTESRLDDQLIPLLRKTLKVFLAVTVAVSVVQHLGYSVTSFIASLGIGGLALALAAKDTVSNFFGSVVVFTDRPFHIGDWVAFGDVEGTVEEVGFRTTRIRRFDKALVTVPNQVFTTTAITNHSARSIRRIKLTVGLTYDTSPDQIRTFLERVRGLLHAHPMVDQQFHFAHFVEYGPSSLDVQVYCFTKTAVWTEWLQAREELMLQVMDVVAELGLDFAFPTQTVHLERAEEA